MANQSSMVFSLFLLLLLLCDLLQTIHANDQTHGGLSFRMIYRYSRESPLYQPNVTNEEMTERLFRMSDERIQSLMSSSSNNSAFRFSNPQAIRPSLDNISLFLYMVQVGIGTFGTVPPHKTYYLILDTGSYSIWTQCQGCNPCFNQAHPPFPWTESRTYGPVPCNRCAYPAACQHGHYCRVERAYEDGTRVDGIEATETFTVQSDNNRFERIPNIRFTCALRVKNFLLSKLPNNVVSGIFGMDRGESSFVRQIQGHSKGRFSYCLQPLDTQGRRSPMFLRFGDDIPDQWIHQHNTPLLPGPRVRSNLYYLNLQGISVGRTRLSIDHQVFDIKPDGSGGCLIDTGTAVTRIIDPAYNALENAVSQYIEAHNPHLRRVPPQPDIRLCYEKTGPETTANQFPSITFHFANNADFIVQPERFMIVLVDSRKLHCFSMKPTNLGTVLGATVQVNHRIVYDLRNSRLFFSPHDCSSSN